MKRYCISCCWECEKRAVGCHSTCQEYIREKEEYDIYKEEERKRKDQHEQRFVTHNKKWRKEV